MSREYVVKYKRQYETETGETDERWCSLGAASEGATGNIVVFIDALPPPQVQWDSTLMLFPKRKKR